MDGYQFSVKLTTAHYMSLGRKAEMHSSRVYRATVQCEEPSGLEYVSQQDFKTKAEAEKWAKTLVAQRKQFYKERGFHWHKPWQLVQGTTTLAQYQSASGAIKAGLLVGRPDNAQYHLWIVQKRKKPDGPTAAILRWYDSKGDPIAQEEGVWYRKRNR